MLSESENIFWYVLFAANGKAAKISNYLKTNNIEYFFPVNYKEKQIRNTQLTRYVLQPLIGNLVFVKSSKKCLEPYLQEIKLRFSITTDLYYRDFGSREVIVVPETQMQNFMLVANSRQKDFIYLSNEEVNIQKGRKVKIIGGAFEGLEGIFMRIKGNRRVVVSIPNLLSVATVFIPSQFILLLE
jgi:transcription antitermination factor NusG